MQAVVGGGCADQQRVIEAHRAPPFQGRGREFEDDGGVRVGGEWCGVSNGTETTRLGAMWVTVCGEEARQVGVGPIWAGRLESRRGPSRVNIEQWCTVYSTLRHRRLTGLRFLPPLR